MYSPKIDENLIPVLYHTAKQRRIPMTRLVDRLLYRALALEPMPFEAHAKFLPYRIAPFPDRQTTHTSPGVGSLEELTQVFHGASAFPFRDRREVEAWYSAAVHGFCRALELSLQEMGEDPSRDTANAEFFGQICSMRSRANSLLEMRVHNVAEKPPTAEISPILGR